MTMYGSLCVWDMGWSLWKPHELLRTVIVLVGVCCRCHLLVVWSWAREVQAMTDSCVRMRTRLFPCWDASRGSRFGDRLNAPPWRVHPSCGGSCCDGVTIAGSIIDMSRENPPRVFRLPFYGSSYHKGSYYVVAWHVANFVKRKRKKHDKMRTKRRFKMRDFLRWKTGAGEGSGRLNALTEGHWWIAGFLMAAFCLHREWWLMNSFKWWLTGHSHFVCCGNRWMRDIDCWWALFVWRVIIEQDALVQTYLNPHSSGKGGGYVFHSQIYERYKSMKKFNFILSKNKRFCHRCANFASTCEANKFCWK